MYKFCPYCGTEYVSKDADFFSCQNCGKKFYLNSRPTASIIPIFEEEYLLSIRGIEPQKGQLDLIGGFLNWGEDPLDGAVREFKEETGIIINKQQLDLLGIWMGDYLYQEEKLQLLNIIYVIKFSEKVYPKGNDDVAELKWFSIKSKQKFGFEYIEQIHDELIKKFGL